LTPQACEAQVDCDWRYRTSAIGNVREKYCPPLRRLSIPCSSRVGDGDRLSAADLARPPIDCLREDEVGHLEGSHRIRARSSTDEWWLGLALGPGLLGGGLLRLLFGEEYWIATGWSITWLLLASAGTVWFWARDRTAHVFFLAVYLAMAFIVLGLGIVAWR